MLAPASLTTQRHETLHGAGGAKAASLAKVGAAVALAHPVTAVGVIGLGLIAAGQRDKGWVKRHKKRIMSKLDVDPTAEISVTDIYYAGLALVREASKPARTSDASFGADILSHQVVFVNLVAFLKCLFGICVCFRLSELSIRRPNEQEDSNQMSDAVIEPAYLNHHTTGVDQGLNNHRPSTTISRDDTHFARMSPHGRPPSYYSVDPPDYSSLAHEQSPLLPTNGDFGKGAGRSFWGKRAFLLLLAILLTIVIIFLLFGIFIIVETAPKHDKHQPPYQEPPLNNYSVAIIGAGPAGLAVAATLAREVAQSRLKLNLSITILEQGDWVGGRLSPTINESAQALPSFGHDLLSLIGPEEIAGPHLLNCSPTLQGQNRYTGLHPEFFEIESRVGIHNGKKILDDLLRPSMKTSWTSWLGQIFKYGASVWRAPNVPDATITKLHRLSTLHKSPGYPFRTTEALVSALGLSSEVSSTGAQMLRAAGISPQYEANIISPETQKRFKQRPEHLTNLALSMSLHDADKGSRYAGGHVLPILQDLLHASGAAKRLGTRVNRIRRVEVAPGKFQWVLRTEQQAGQNDDGQDYTAFDKVILAAPFQPSVLSIEFGDGGKPPPRPIPYLDDHITFFTSRSPLAIDHLGDSESGPRRLLFSDAASHPQSPLHGIRELAFVKDIVHYHNQTHETITEHLFRTSSSQALTHTTLEYLLAGAEAVTWKHHHYVENAYPLLLPEAPLPSFEWHESFWHTGAIEAVGSSLDLSLAAGINVAALVMVELRDLCRSEKT